MKFKNIVSAFLTLFLSTSLFFSNDLLAMEKDEEQENSFRSSQPHTPFPTVSLRHMPFVTPSVSGTFKINPTFLDNFEDILKLVRMSYRIAEEPSDIDITNIENWKKKVFEGKTGVIFKDSPGFVAYSSQKNILAVIFHGSNSDGDWMTNFGILPQVFEQFKYYDDSPVEGKKEEKTLSVHSGFLGKYLQCKESLEEVLNDFWGTLNTQEQNDVKLIVAGHSQGAALASIASIDLVKCFLQKKFGEQYDNKKSNRLYAFLLSSPSIASPHLALKAKQCYENHEGTSKQIATAFNDIIGERNAISYSVLYDPVTWIGFDKLVEKIASFVLLPEPAIKKLMTTVETNVLGHLAIRHADETWSEGMGITLFNKLDRIMRGHIIEELISPLRAPNTALSYIIKKAVGSVILGSVGGWISLLSDTKKLYFFLNSPLHLGSSAHNKELSFDPSLAKKDLRAGLTKAHYYQKGEIISPEIKQSNREVQSIMGGLMKWCRKGANQAYAIVQNPSVVPKKLLTWCFIGFEYVVNKERRILNEMIEKLRKNMEEQHKNDSYEKQVGKLVKHIQELKISNTQKNTLRQSLAIVVGNQDVSFENLKDVLLEYGIAMGFKDVSKPLKRIESEFRCLRSDLTYPLIFHKTHKNMEEQIFENFFKSAKIEFLKIED